MMDTGANAAAPPPAPSRIHPLPKSVVDRIAAGEVVQRPASVAKELIENSLDADSTTIDIQAQSGGLRLLAVTDDGVGISPPDLQLAATRFATSKLVDFGDLRSIRTFGFRGEALASASMVGRLSITSRRRKRSAATAASAQRDDDEAKYSTSCAYRQTYSDGAPVAPRPAPAAGREGTVVKLEDLFHNVQARRRAFAGSRKEKEEYGRILAVAQRYAVHRAGNGVGIVCRKKGGNSDLNTPGIPSVRALKERRIKRRGAGGGTASAESEPEGNKEEDAATRDVIGHVFGSSVARELMTLRCGEGDVDAVSLAALTVMREKEKSGAEATDDSGGPKDGDAAGLSEEMGGDNNGDSGNEKGDDENDESPGHYAFAYKAFGLLTNGSFCAPKSSSAFVLFINDRLVESAPLRRAVESAYADSLPRGAKPFVYLSLELPGPHVDVNIHPTKREVAFLHEDRLCDALARATKDVLCSAQASRTFYAQALLPRGTSDDGAGSSSVTSSRAAAARAGATKTTGAANGGSAPKSNVDDGGTEANGPQSDVTEGTEDSTKSPPPSSQSKKRSSSDTSSTSGKKRYDPTRLVRTNLAAPAGALEPFLVSQPSQSQPGSQGVAGQSSDTVSRRQQPGTNGGTGATAAFVHSETCELASGASQSVDMTLPGAFASLICRCQVERGNTLPPVQRGSGSATTNPASASAVIRPKKITPTQSSYSSVQSLRSDVTSRAHRELSTKLRDSTFVGSISRHRSLIQWGIELLMIKHSELGRELFYQIALARFGGFPKATMGGEGVNVKVAIGQALQLEEDIASGRVGGGDGQKTSAASSTISETNNDLAEQATKCLSDRADMLEEYFSLQFQQRSDSENSGGEDALMLVGLPVLLEGHSPPPHALPLFLLRLATEVDWNEERPCFEGVCTELGSFYSEIPYDFEADDTEASVPIENEVEEAVASDPLESETEEKGRPKELIDEVAKNFVKHTLYPAISFLLVPPKDFASDGTVVKLALLSSLYKVFERC